MRDIFASSYCIHGLLTIVIATPEFRGTASALNRLLRGKRCRQCSSHQCFDGGWHKYSFSLLYVNSLRVFGNMLVELFARTSHIPGSLNAIR